MTDMQLLTLAISIVIPGAMLLYSNSRITDTKDTLSAKLDALRSEMNLGLERLDHEWRNTK